LGFQNSVSRQTLLDSGPIAVHRIQRERHSAWGRQVSARLIWPVALGIEAIKLGATVFSSLRLKTLARSARTAHWRDGSVSQTMNKLLRNDLIILDELGYIQLDATGSDSLVPIGCAGHDERRSLIVTSQP